jgi:bifunctional non-homologous end joining protein LigD
MSEKLRKYRKKRDFVGTPEPKGEAPPQDSPQQRFVVQKHDATRLHYDLRLEIEGVLKSWAIPKGPSLDPSEKRLAVATEDHPMKYLDFEDVIPDGHYGAGNMIVWDRGPYECFGKEKDPRAAYEKGTLDLCLHGEKLKGMWLLVRLKEKDQWLFFKKEDRYATAERDITESMPESVLSGLRVEELLPGQSAGWSSRLERVLSDLQLHPQPFKETVRPMLATLVDSPPEGPRWSYELKYDGIRALAEKKTAFSGSTHVI